jgi:hypothetical protein
MIGKYQDKLLLEEEKQKIYTAWSRSYPQIKQFIKHTSMAK